ncbi:hypothetical protein I7I50_01427 [Histoplasma capsulatum G186AR]|nr:hypothetical protein I7I50_01427 [Histoplasma capsulatum G186AR]
MPSLHFGSGFCAVPFFCFAGGETYTLFEKKKKRKEKHPEESIVAGRPNRKTKICREGGNENERELPERSKIKKKKKKKKKSLSNSTTVHDMLCYML